MFVFHIILLYEPYTTPKGRCGLDHMVVGFTPITTEIVSSNPDQARFTLCDIM